MAYYLLVEEAGRRGIPLMDALDMLKESSAQEPKKAVESDEASIARRNEQSMQELQQMLQGAR